MDTDQELFNSAISDAPISEPEPAATPEPAPTQATAEPGEAGQPRDERGRFAPRAGDLPQQPAAQAQPAPEAQPGQQSPKDDGPAIPAWRLSEVTQERNALRDQLAELRRQNELFAMQMRQFQQQPREPEKVPDVFEDPNAFLRHGVQQAITPVQSQVAQVTEYYSRARAIDKHGEEAVNAAYDALDQALRSRDPDAHAAFQRAQSSIDPFGEVMKWHRKTSVLREIGEDPNAWYEKRLEQTLADPAQVAKLMERIRGQVQQPATNGSRPNATFQVPPSLSRVPAAASRTADDDTDMSDAGLYRHATR